MSLPVVFDRRGIVNPHLVPANMDAFVRAQIKEQVIQSPNITYTPVSWEETRATDNAPGPSSTGLMDAPFIAVVTFIRIAHPANGGRRGSAGVVLKASRNVIQLTPGHTQTPCSMMFPAPTFPPNAFEEGVFNMDDPTHHIGMINEGLEIDYLISYWKKTQI